MKSITTKLLNIIFNIYLTIVYKTSSINVIEKENSNYNNCILGFWHGDTCVNYLLFRKLKNRNLNIDVIVTADRRGDYISNICKKHNVNPLRIPDGIKIRGHLRYIKDIAKIKNRSIAIALDGPLGPLHEPKKIGFILSNEANKNFVKINVKVKRKIVLSKRWDNYIIPIPFSKIIFELDKGNVVDKETLKNFNINKTIFKPVKTDFSYD